MRAPAYNFVGVGICLHYGVRRVVSWLGDYVGQNSKTQKHISDLCFNLRETLYSWRCLRQQ